ncbi:Uncharacterised protein [Mycobacteroides abscessus subsp. abscessus]|nr:Uncharacterised protein [Mycobacteroides abscessus subsp. abscessus]
MAAKNVKWFSLWMIPKVKHPHSSGLGMSMTWLRISSTDMCPCVTGANSMSAGSLIECLMNSPSSVRSNQLRKVSCRRRYALRAWFMAAISQFPGTSQLAMICREKFSPALLRS